MPSERKRSGRSGGSSAAAAGGRGFTIPGATGSTANDFTAILGPEDPRVVNDYGGSVAQRVQRVKRSKKYADVEFKLHDGTIVPAHRVVLASRSPVFASMFYDNFVESKPVHGHDKVHVDILDLSPEGFQHMINDIYDITTSVTSANVLQVLGAANRFQVEDTAVRCISFLVNTVMNAQNACDVYRMIPTWVRDKTGLKAVLHLIGSNFTTVMKTESFLYLDPIRLHTILDSDNLVATSEADVFNALVSWAQFQALLLHPENRTEAVQDSVTTRIGYNVPKSTTNEYYFEDDRKRIIQSLGLQDDSFAFPNPDPTSITRADVLKALRARVVNAEAASAPYETKLVEDPSQDKETFQQTVVTNISYKLLHACRLGLLSMEELSKHVVTMDVLTKQETLALYRQAARRHLRGRLTSTSTAEERRAARPRISVAGFSGFERKSEVPSPESYIWTVVAGGADDAASGKPTVEKEEFIPTQLASMMVISNEGHTIAKGRRDASSPDVIITTPKAIPVTGTAGFVYWQITCDHMQGFQDRDLVGFQILEEKPGSTAKSFGILVGSNAPSNTDAVLNLNLSPFPATRWADKDRIGFLFETLTGECFVFKNDVYLATLSTIPVALLRQGNMVSLAHLSPYAVLTTNASFTLEVMSRPPAVLNLPE